MSLPYALSSCHWMIKWLIIIVGTGILVGTSSAAFLTALQFVTTLRDSNKTLIYLLPLAGIIIVWLYKRYGSRANKGNNLILEEYYHPSQPLPWTMAPIIMVSTLLTHLFGGSAGREGTAVQYGASIADQFSTPLQLDKSARRILLCCGVAAGFASLFGTPLAGAIFAVEIFRIGKLRYKALLPTLLSAYLANYICIFWQAPHTHYIHVPFSNFRITTLIYVLALGLLCGLVARLFILSSQQLSKAFKKISNSYLRVISGSVLLLICIILLGTDKYIGLGLSTILDSFQQAQPPYAFLIKIALTALTLSVGFKGGEVTPLFFIGATFASALSAYVPVDIMLFTAVGFVAVFAGSTKTPIACTVMAMELFGYGIGLYAVIGCFSALLLAGRKGIYSSQRTF